MLAAEIARTLGRGSRSGYWWRCRCPVHGSRGTTLALRDGERGLIVKCFAGCDSGGILAELRQLGLIGDAKHDRHHPPPASARPDEREGAARRIAMAQRIWDAAQDARGSPVVRYLASRGITIPAPPSLRWAPRCWHREARAWLPALVARVDGLDGGLIGLHRTYLNRDTTGHWHRRDRASLGPIAGSAVRLAPAAETLMIGEGLETLLSAMQATGMPVWAALSTSGIVALSLPPIVRTVIILADHDRSGAGERAAYAAADRWLGEGRRVRIAMPPEPGTDFADVLLGRSYARIEEVPDGAA